MQYIYIKQAILNKKGKLTTEDIMKNHSIYSYNIVKEIINGVVYLNNLPNIVKHHHKSSRDSIFKHLFEKQTKLMR